MTNKHYIQIAICSLVILIASALFSYYYKEYIAPESFVIGTVRQEDYKSLPIKDYLSDDKVLFSQNINDVSFVSKDGTSTYEYNFAPTKFDGTQNEYIIYVNDYMLSNYTLNAGTMNGIYTLNYYDVDRQVLCASNININFSFYSLASKLKVTLPSDELGYLMNYFKTDNFIITLAHNPFGFMDKDGDVDEIIKQLAELNTEVLKLNTELANKNVELADKKAEIESLKNSNLTSNSKILALEEEISGYKTTIAELEQKIADLEYQVSYYEQLLDAYENEKVSVSWRANNEAVLVELVTIGNVPTIPAEPVVDGYTFMGWSLDGYNPIDVTTIPITEETTYTAVLAPAISGVWKGYTDVENRTGFALTLAIADNGVTGYISSEDDFYNEVTGKGYLAENTSTSTITNDYQFGNYWKVYINEDNTLTVVYSVYGYEYILTKTNERMEQTYYTNFEKTISRTDDEGNVVESYVKFDGYTMTLDSTTYWYYVVDNTLYYVNDGAFIGIYSGTYDFEITDTSITIGGYTWSFVE